MTTNKRSGRPRKQRLEAVPLIAEEATLLQRWLAVNGYTSVALEAKSGICRQTMTAIRAGRDLRMKTMIRVARAASALAGRAVRMEELFDLDPYSAANIRLVPLD